MKRGSANSRENSKLASRYSALLEDYLELQKEYVSEKKKLQVEKQKRKIVQDEVRFLRQRHAYLTKPRSGDAEPELGPHKNADIHAMPIRMERNDVVNKTNIEQKVNGKAPIVQKQPKNILLNKKKTGKEKISWPDKVALRV